MTQRRVWIGMAIVSALVCALWWQFSRVDDGADSEEPAPSAEPYIEGRIVDAAGRPVVGARLTSDRGASAETDEDGRFRLDNLEAGRHLLDAEAKGFSSPGTARTRRVEVDLSKEGPEPGVRDLELTLRRAATLTGRVVAGGEPVKGARIDLYYRSVRGLQGELEPYVSSSGVETDEEGRFEIEDVVPGTLQLLVEADEYALYEGQKLNVEPGETLEGVDIDLDPASEVAGQVVDSDGEVVRARLTLRGPTLDRSRRTRSGDDGRFSFRRVPKGRVRVEASAPGFRREVVESIEVESGERTTVDVVMEAADGIFGRVVDPQGEPVDGALVWFANAEEGRPKLLRTDKQGRFQWDDAPKGRLTATAISPHHETSEPVGVHPGHDAELELRSGGSVSGSVVGPDGRPVQVYSIGVESFEVDGPRPYRTRAIEVREVNDSTGRFSFESLRPGAYWFRVRSDRFADGTSERVYVRPERTTRNVKIRLGEAGTIVGRVLEEESSKPVAGASVILLEPGSPFSAGRTRTDDSGRFEIDGVPPGRQSLRVTKKDYLATVEAGLQVEPGSQVESDVEIRRQRDGERMQFQGIGAVLGEDDDGIFIRDALDGHPASEFGLSEGDYIRSVDGESVDGMRMSEVIERIRGQQGTAVDIEAERDDGGRFEVEVERGKVVVD